MCNWDSRNCIPWLWGVGPRPVPDYSVVNELLEKAGCGPNEHSGIPASLGVFPTNNYNTLQTLFFARQ